MGPEVPLNRRNTKQEALFQSKNSRKTKIKEQYFLERTYYVNLFLKISVATWFILKVIQHKRGKQHTMTT